MKQITLKSCLFILLAGTLVGLSGPAGCDRPVNERDKVTDAAGAPDADSSGANLAAPSPDPDGVGGQVANAVPPIIATPSAVDFGLVKPGSTLETEVVLTNTSDRALRILKAQPSCTCTAVDMTNVVVPARSSVTMPITMTTNLAVGRKRAMVQLVIEGFPRFLTVNLDAENALAIRASPPHLSVKERPDQPERRAGEFLLESTDRRPFRVLSVLTEDPVFVDHDPTSQPPRNRYRLRYDFSDRSCEQMPPFLIIRTDHPEAPLMDLRVRHDPCTKIRTTMPMSDFRSNLGLMKPGEKTEFQVEFKKPRKPVMDAVLCDDPRATALLLDQTNDGTNLKVTAQVNLAPDIEEGLFQIPILFTDGNLTDMHLVYGWIQK